MLIRILTIISILTACECFGQDSSATHDLKQRLILTEEQNIRWFDSLKVLPISAQINFINERVMLDTNVYVRHGMPDRIKINYDSIYKTKYAGCCKLLVILSKPTITLYFDDYYKKPDAGEAIKFGEILTQIKIDKIWVMRDPTATAIYGRAAENGVIFLNVSDKRSINILKSSYKSN